VAKKVTAETKSRVPASDSYYSHHSPFGAYSTFTLGRFGKGGGFALESGQVPSQNVFVAYSRPNEPVRALPFYQGSVSGAENFTGQAASTENAFAKAGWVPFKAEEITRSLKWASDTWKAGDLRFTIFTPVQSLADFEYELTDKLKLALCPALIAELEFDNSQSKTPGWAFFGVGNIGKPMRVLGQDASLSLPGLARGNEWGFGYRATSEHIPELENVLSFELPELVRAGRSKVHLLASDGGVLIRAKAGQRVTVTLALGFYRGGIATTGLTTEYYYTRFFDNIEDVLAYALDHHTRYKDDAGVIDRRLERSGLSPTRQWLISQATRSYYGSTQLLRRGGHPLWVVNEGEYCMMNTFDLAVDHLFFELRHHPWTVRNMLDLYVERYSYMDEVMLPKDGGSKREKFLGGISFTHDMGTHNQFTRKGCSSYELTNLDGCFSHMTHEQLVNWVCCGALYGLRRPVERDTAPAGRDAGATYAGDKRWIREREPIFLACLESLIRRDSPPGAKRDGVMSLDSSRCGTGQEITTYDSLDVSLGQARSNLYLAVKTWAAYVLLGHVFRQLGRGHLEKDALIQASICAKTITSKYDRKLGFIPAVFEEGNHSAIIPAIEGLVFPYTIGDDEAVSENGPYGKMIHALKTHLKNVLKPGVCLDSASGGWKLSSTNNNTWASKIQLCQFVAETVLGFNFGPSIPKWDAIHAAWQCNEFADFAMSDQLDSTNGKPIGSRYYPRGVTNILWMNDF
jgi:hypothetical protein